MRGAVAGPAVSSPQVRLGLGLPGDLGAMSSSAIDEPIGDLPVVVSSAY